MNLSIAGRPEKLSFPLPEVGLGVFGTGAIIALLPAAVGLPHAKALMRLGREFGAEEAERWV